MSSVAESLDYPAGTIPPLFVSVSLPFHFFLYCFFTHTYALFVDATLPPAPYVVSCLVFLSCLICLPVHPVHPNPNNLSLLVLSSPPQNHYGSAERSNWPSEQNKPIDFISSSRKKWNPITNGCETAIAVAAAAAAAAAIAPPNQLHQMLVVTWLTRISQERQVP